MYSYRNLGKPMRVRRPAFCEIGEKVTILDIHPADPKHRWLPVYEGRVGTLCAGEMERRVENPSVNPKQRSYISCCLEIDGVIQHFKAVRFRRAFTEEIHGKDFHSTLTA